MVILLDYLFILKIKKRKLIFDDFINIVMKFKLYILLNN